MNIGPAVTPDAFPGVPTDDDGMGGPEERWAGPPTPRPEGGGDRHRRSKPDGCAYQETGPRPSILRRISARALCTSAAAGEQLMAELASRHPAGVVSPWGTIVIRLAIG